MEERICVMSYNVCLTTWYVEFAASIDFEIYTQSKGEKRGIIKNYLLLNRIVKIYY